MPLSEKKPLRELSEFDRRWARAMKVQREILRQYGVLADLSVKALPGSRENVPESTAWSWKPDPPFAPKAVTVFSGDERSEREPAPAEERSGDTAPAPAPGLTSEDGAAEQPVPEAASEGEAASLAAKLRSRLRGAAATAAAAAAIAAAPFAARKGAQAPEGPVEPIVREPVAGPEIPGAPEDAEESVPAAVESDEEERKAARRQILRGAVSGIKALTGLAITVIARVFLAVLTGSIPFLSGPVGTLIGSAVTFFLCMLVLVSVLFKLFFPDRKLSELWTKKRLLILCVLSVVHGAAEAIVPAALSGTRGFAAALALTVFDAALVFAALRLLLGKLKALPAVGKLIPAGRTLRTACAVFIALALARGLLAAHSGLRAYASAAVLFCLVLGAYLLFRRIAPKAGADAFPSGS